MFILLNLFSTNHCPTSPSVAVPTSSFQQESTSLQFYASIDTRSLLSYIRMGYHNLVVEQFLADRPSPRQLLTGFPFSISGNMFTACTTDLKREDQLSTLKTHSMAFMACSLRQQSSPSPRHKNLSRFIFRFQDEVGRKELNSRNWPGYSGLSSRSTSV